MPSRHIAIQVRALSKAYTIKHNAVKHDTLASAIMYGLRHPFQKDRSETFWALRDVDFEVKKGDVVGIVGRNGAGKSTLLKILSRITEPTSGQIDLYGRVGSLLEVGTGFHPELTGRENIYLNGSILGMKRTEIDRQFDAIVDFSGVEHFLDTPVKRYSSGMYVRLAFAVAAHLNPQILVVDEVLAVGDAAFQRKCLGKLESVAHDQGKTVLFVSHNMAAVQRLCNTGIYLSAGRVEMVSSAEEVTRAYLADGIESSLHWVRSASDGAAACFRKIWLSDLEDRALEYVTTDQAIRVHFEFEVSERCDDLQISMGLMNDFGEQIFGSSPLDCGIPAPERPGKYHFTMDLASDLLLPKPYSIRASLWHLYAGTFDCLDVIRFTPAETASLVNSTPGGRVGQISLRCSWNAMVEDSIDSHGSPARASTLIAEAPQ